MNLLGNATGKELSVIKDPFNKQGVADISIRRTSWGSSWFWYGCVEFQNGNTKGEQRTPHCNTFEEVLSQVKIILDSVNK